MARTKGAKDSVLRETLSQTELELWPLYTQFEFDDWVQEIIDGQPQDDEDKEIVVQNTTGKEGKGEVLIDGVIYPNVHQACKALGVSNSLVYKWLKSGKAVRLSEQKPSIVINGRYFNSVEEAVRALKVPKKIVEAWLKYDV